MSLPDTPIGRIEAYLAKTAGQDVQLPPYPIGRIEEYLAAIAGSVEKLTGNPLSFTTQSVQDAKSCVITLNPIQAGSGDPSPTNVREISGRDSVVLIVANGDDPTAEGYEKATDLTLSLPETVYGGTIDVKTGKVWSRMGLVDLGTLSWTYVATSGGYFYATIEDIRRRNDSIFADIYPNAGNVSIGDMPDKSIRGSTSSALVLIKDSRYTDATAFTTAMSGIYACYQLSAGYALQLTPAQVKLLAGANYVSTDGDSIELTYSNGIAATLEEVSELTDDLNTRVPTPPTENGTYKLQVTVSDGVATYEWKS